MAVRVGWLLIQVALIQVALIQVALIQMALDNEPGGSK
jgi:hypothetical protein